MKLLRHSLALCALIGALGFSVLALAADKPAAAASASEDDDDTPKDLVLKGDAKCTSCHDADDSPKLFAIGRTKHGTVVDGRTPTCTSCHGATDKHIKKKGNVSPDVIFGTKKGSFLPSDAKVQNDACLSCHEKDAKRNHWEGSTHEANDVPCAACHKLHAVRDPVRDKRTQSEVCFACHKQQRTEINRPSHHPIPEGKMGCSDCHNVHGSAGPKLMVRDSVNDTCYTCHMEKRGPFVHNHEPVDDDCTNCHNPHGTTAESMLKMRPPFLCNTCHTPHGAVQPLLSGQAAAPNVTSWQGGITITQGRGCMNCHTQVHGSNNPSATNPTPQRFFR